MVSIALKEHELELLKAKRKRKKGKIELMIMKFCGKVTENVIVLLCIVILFLAHMQNSRLRGRKESF